jgi:hypothetical protein
MKNTGNLNMCEYSLPHGLSLARQGREFFIENAWIAGSRIGHYLFST